MSKQPNRRGMTSKCKERLTALFGNCCSIKNNADIFSGLTETIKRWIVLGMEFWLDSSINGSKVLPCGVKVYHRWRH